MRVARDAASSALGVFRAFQRDGVGAALRSLNLADLVGRPAQDVFLGLTDVVCQDGGSIDEGIVRDAWLEAIAELQDLDINELNTTERMRDFFLAFVAHTIELRLFQDVGTNGLKNAPDLAAIEAFQQQFRSYIRRSVHDSFAGDLSRLGSLTDQQIRALVDRTYRDAWDLLIAWGDAAE